MLARIEPLIAVKVEVCEHPCSIVRHPFVFVEQQTIEGLFGGIVFDALRVEGDFKQVFFGEPFGKHLAKCGKRMGFHVLFRNIFWDSGRRCIATLLLPCKTDSTDSG